MDFSLENSRDRTFNLTSLATGVLVGQAETYEQAERLAAIRGISSYVIEDVTEQINCRRVVIPGARAIAHRTLAERARRSARADVVTA